MREPARNNEFACFNAKDPFGSRIDAVPVAPAPIETATVEIELAWPF